MNEKLSPFALHKQINHNLQKMNTAAHQRIISRDYEL